MARISLIPISRDFKFKWQEEDVAISVRQARTGDAIQLSNLFSETTRVWDDQDYGTIQLKQKWNQQELQRERAYLCLTACNLEREDGEPIFEFRQGRNGLESAMTRSQFNAAWDLLPSELTEQMHDLIVKANPQWGPKAGE